MHRFLLCLALLAAGCDSAQREPLDPADPLSDSADRPYFPGNLEMASSSGSSIDLKWEDRSAFETGYAVQRLAWNPSRLAVTPPPEEGFETVAQLPADTEAFVDSDVAGAETWVYRVVPLGGESLPSNALVVTATSEATLAGPGNRPSVAITGDGTHVAVIADEQLRVFSSPEGAPLATSTASAYAPLVAGQSCFAARIGTESTVFQSDLSPFWTGFAGGDELGITGDCSRVASLRQFSTISIAEASGEFFGPYVENAYILALSDDGEMTFSVGDSGETIKARRVSDGGVAWEQAPEAGYTVESLAVGGEVLVAHLFEIASGTSVIASFRGSDGMRLASFSGRASRLAAHETVAAGTDGVNVLVWSLPDLTLLRTIRPRSGDRLIGRRVTSLSISDAPGGPLLAMGLRLDAIQPDASGLIYRANRAWQAVPLLPDVN